MFHVSSFSYLSDLEFFVRAYSWFIPVEIACSAKDSYRWAKFSFSFGLPQENVDITLVA